MRLERAIRVLAPCAALLVLSPSARGGDATPAATGAADDSLNRALARFKRGQELYAERNFAAALIEFRKAYEIAPNYRLQYNIGQVCYQMQDYVCALRALTHYMTDGGADIAEGRRQAVAQEIDGLKQRVGFLDLTTDVAGAEVSVDDVVVGTTPLAEPVALSAGRRRIVVQKAGYAPVTRSIDLAGQDTAHVKLVLPTMGAVTAPPTRGERPNAPASARGGMTTLSWIGYGVGAAMGIAAGVTGAFALDAASDVRNTTFASDTAASSARRRAGVLGAVTDGLIAGAVVTVAVTTIMTFVVTGSPSKTAGALAQPGAGTWHF